MKYIIRFSTLFIFWSDWIWSVQNGSNLIKLDFWWNNHWNISSDFQFFYQNGSDLSKMDQTGSNLISDEIIIEIYHQILNFIYFLIKMDQNGSNLIKLDFWWNNHWNISSDFQFYLSFDQIESDLSKIVNIIKFAIFINFISFSFLSLQSFWLHLISFVIFISSIIVFCFFI